MFLFFNLNVVLTSQIHRIQHFAFARQSLCMKRDWFEMYRVLSFALQTYVRTVSKCSSKFTVKRDCHYASSVCFDKQPRWTKYHCSANNTLRILRKRAIFSTIKYSIIHAHFARSSILVPQYFDIQIAFLSIT